MSQQLELSSSTISRSVSELRSVHLVVKSRWEAGIQPHPAVAFFGTADAQQRELERLAAFERAAFRHLEAAA
ncbi:hypothetical protein ACIRPK_24175 [Kitasatospora sp. NPDC101801]|uniref:hypothetical protein n=1 Tax=Kitasatospora sp. NPDC101801 TaxID=3364103 RepID=UPI00382EE9B3